MLNILIMSTTNTSTVADNHHHHNGVPPLILQAAQAAAQADGVLAAQEQQAQNASVLQQAKIAVQQQQRKKSGGGSKKGPPLRRGKWTPEEEAYAARLIQEFKAGLLPLTDGTTLRTFLSKLLNCDPMRISKKFVGSNCIGKQVFRRRTTDMNRLTTDQIQQSRAELSELERRFLERVAQTNRVKNTGVTAVKVDAAATMADSAPSSSSANYNAAMNGMALSQQQQGQQQQQQQQLAQQQQQHFQEVISNPPWLQPPNGYRHGMGAAMAAGNARAAAAGRAMLAAGMNTGNVLAELQRQASLTNAFQNHPLLAAVSGSSSAALQQLARDASGALGGSNEVGSASMNSLNFLTSALSRDQLSQLAQQASSNNLNTRQNSFDALMSLDLHSLQSMDNLASLIQNSGGGNPSLSNLPQAGLKNADFSQPLQHQQQQQQHLSYLNGTDDNSGTNGWMQRLASSNRVQSFLRSLSSNMNLNQAVNQHSSDTSFAIPSNANLANLLQSMQATPHQQQPHNHPYVTNSSSVSLADLLRRQDSHTGLSALRVQDGLNHRNTSVDDFLSLMAAGDIPHQDASLLNIPLANLQQTDPSLVTSSSLSNAIENRRFPSATALAMVQARAAAAPQQQQQLKRSIAEVTGEVTSQENDKR